VNECAGGTNPCGPDGTCSNSAGGYTCECPDGYEFREGTCLDVDECVSGGSACGNHGDCVNTIGAFFCNCHAGFRFDAENGGVCKDFDECKVVKPCENAICTNLPGSYECRCREGYQE
jgi:hypothetical protein